MSKSGKKHSILFLIFLLFFTSASNATSFDNNKALYEQKKFSQAFPLIKEEAKKGDANAQFLLGKMYQRGEGTSVNINKAVYWYTQSANHNNADAQNNLANLYANGYGVKKDLKQAFELYSKSANQGKVSAQFNLGIMYQKGEYVKQDNKKAFDLFRQAAESGDSDAQYNVAVSYTEGRGIPQDYTQALYWYEKAAAQDNTLAQHALGIVYRNGEGVPVDVDKAIYWYKKAAAKGYTDSMWNLSTIYLPEDIHDVKGWEEVHHWYTLGMQHGDKTNAPLGMGLIYLLGRGNYTVDSGKAGALFTLAAENGNADAWYWLGVMEEYGFGRPQNEEKAMALYRKAADAGVEPAINRLEHGHRDWSMKLFKALRPLFGP